MCMRVLGVVALMVVLIKALLGFAFFAGYWWLGGWEAGLLLCGDATPPDGAVGRGSRGGL